MTSWGSFFGELREGLSEFTSQLIEDSETVTEVAKHEVESVKSRLEAAHLGERMRGGAGEVMRGAAGVGSELSQLAQAAELGRAKQALAAGASRLGQRLGPSGILGLGAAVFHELEGAVTQADEAVGALLARGAARAAGPSTPTDNPDAATARLAARVRSLSADAGAALLRAPPDRAGFERFCAGFELLSHTEEIEERLRQEPDLRATHRALVPAKMTYKQFWERYYYQVHLLTLQHERRQALLQRTPPRAPASDPLSSWGDDDTPFLEWGDETAKPAARRPLPVNKTRASFPATAPIAAAPTCGAPLPGSQKKQPPTPQRSDSAGANAPAAAPQPPTKHPQPPVGSPASEAAPPSTPPAVAAGAKSPVPAAKSPLPRAMPPLAPPPPAHASPSLDAIPTAASPTDAAAASIASAQRSRPPNDTANARADELSAPAANAHSAFVATPAPSPAGIPAAPTRAPAPQPPPPADVDATSGLWRAGAGSRNSADGPKNSAGGGQKAAAAADGSTDENRSDDGSFALPPASPTPDSSSKTETQHGTTHTPHSYCGRGSASTDACGSVTGATCRDASGGGPACNAPSLSCSGLTPPTRGGCLPSRPAKAHAFPPQTKASSPPRGQPGAPSHPRLTHPSAAPAHPSPAGSRHSPSSSCSSGLASSASLIEAPSDISTFEAAISEGGAGRADGSGWCSDFAPSERAVSERAVSETPSDWGWEEEVEVSGTSGTSCSADDLRGIPGGAGGRAAGGGAGEGGGVAAGAVAPLGGGAKGCGGAAGEGSASAGGGGAGGATGGAAASWGVLTGIGSAAATLHGAALHSRGSAAPPPEHHPPPAGVLALLPSPGEENDDDDWGDWE